MPNGVERERRRFGEQSATLSISLCPKLGASPPIAKDSESARTLTVSAVAAASSRGFLLTIFAPPDKIPPRGFFRISLVFFLPTRYNNDEIANAQRRRAGRRVETRPGNRAGHYNYVSGVLTGDRRLAAEFWSEHIPPFLASALDRSRIGSEKTNYVDEKLRGGFLDVAFSAPYTGFDDRRRLVVAIDRKSSIEKRAPFRLLKYRANMSDDLYSNGARLPDGRSFWPLPVLLYNGSREWKKTPTLPDAVGALRDAPCSEEYERLYVPPFNYCALDLAATKAEDLRGGPTVRVFLEALKRATDGTLIDAMRNLVLLRNLKKIDRGYDWERLVSFFKKTIRYIGYTARNSGKRVDASVYYKVMESIGDTRVNEAMKTFIDDFKAEGREEGYATGLEKGLARGLEQGLERGIEKGIEQGLERGIEQGLEKGRAEGRYETIFELIQKRLNKRFGDQIPQRLRDKIEAINDYPALEEILEFAWDAKSLDEMESYVDRFGAQK